MYMKYLVSFLLIFTYTISLAQSDNMTLMHQYNPPKPIYAGVKFNDVWGFTSANNEYALIGTATSIDIMRVNSCNNPVVVDTISSNASGAPGSGESVIWRDIKTYGSYAYAVCDGCNEGMKIIDLSDVDNGNVSHSVISNDFSSAHNIYIDELNAKLYVCGGNFGNGIDLLIYDLSSPAVPSLCKRINFNDPDGAGGNPPLSTTDFYIHDLYVENNIAYCSHGYTGMYVWDLSGLDCSTGIDNYSIANEADVKSYSTGAGPTGYNHSSWKSADRIYLAEEVPTGRPMIVLQETETDLVFKSTFNSKLVSSASNLPTPHNPFVHNDLLYISYYEDGIQVFDISNPDSPTPHAFFDTYSLNNSGNYSGTEGNWGVYPFFNSGCIIANDVTFGTHFLMLGNITVPVEWLSFTANNVGGKNLINWSTASEQNNSHFNILRSTDGHRYNHIGQVKGANNSSDVNEYSHADLNPIVGKNYYKLEQVDMDGKVTYSEIRLVDNKITTGMKLSIFPNPTRDQITIKTNIDSQGKISLSFLDQRGRLLKTLDIEVQDLKEGLKYNIPDDWVEGTYHLVIYDSNNQILDRSSISVIR